MTIKNMALEQALALIESNDDFRVLRRFDSSSLLRDTEVPADAGYAVALDTETTGRDTENDRIIELGLVPFAYDKQTGFIYRAFEPFNALEDPEMPIPEAASRVNGITDEMVAGKRIDDAKVQSIIERADFVLAHNSGFDRKFCERRMPFFKNVPWACSLQQMSWDAAGISSGKLEFIAFRLGFFYEAHRAETDCLALLHALNQPLEELNGANAMSVILEQFQKESRRVWATGAPFDAKEILKGRNYRWSDGMKPGTEKAWHIDVELQDLEAELEWLKDAVYNRRQFSVSVDHINAFNRFTDRAGERERLYR